MIDILIRVVCCVGLGVCYMFLSDLIGFENTVLLCMGTIIADIAFLPGKKTIIKNKKR